MTIKAQLHKYHVGKGLYGSRLRSAVLKDSIRARHYSGGRHPGSCLSGAFVWAASPEGGDYWSQRCWF